MSLFGKTKAIFYIFCPPVRKTFPCHCTHCGNLWSVVPGAKSRRWAPLTRDTQ